MKNLTPLFTLIFILLAPLSFGQSGTLDPSFGAGGIVTTSNPGNNHGEAVAIQTDEKIVIVGTSEEPTGNFNVRVSRYLTDGSVDNTFGTNGTVVFTSPSSLGRSVAIQTDDKILIAGKTGGGWNSYDALVVRLNPDGTFDASFGIGGIATFNFMGTGIEYYESVIIQPDGKIVLAGTISDPGGYDFVIFRCNADGSLDNTFGNAGLTVIAKTGFQFLQNCLLQEDGKFVLIGSDQSNSLQRDIMLARVNTDGTLDNSFGTSGIVTTDIFLGNDQGNSGVQQADGKIVVAGVAEINSGPQTYVDFCTLRYNTDGTLDNTFNSGGIVISDLDGGEDRVTSIAIQSDGNIVVAGDGIIDPFGDSTRQWGMFRYLPDGSLDNSFGTNGKVITQIDVTEDLCKAMVLYPTNDQEILLVGSSLDTSGVRTVGLARYLNGSVGIGELQYEPNDLSVFPNPINRESVINYTLVQNETISIKLFDLNGQLVRTILESENQTEGEYQIDLNISDALSNGNYLLKLESESWQHTINILK